MISNLGAIFYAFPQPRIKVKYCGRPQRFLVEIELPNGLRAMAYCSNPGSFAGCLRPGSPAIVTCHDSAYRKLRYTLVAIRSGKTWIGSNTHLANEIVEKSINTESLACFSGYKISKREPQEKAGARLDFVLESKDGPCYLEVKSAAVCKHGLAQYPDSKTIRSPRQLQQLASLAKNGHDAALLFVIQRSDAKGFRINHGFDSVFDDALLLAKKAKVRFEAVKYNVSMRGLSKPIPIPIDWT